MFEVVDEIPAWERDDFDRWFEQLVAADPESPPDTAAVVAASGTAAVTPGLIAQLAEIEPDASSPSDQVGLAVAWARIENYATARKLAAIARVAGPAPRHDLDDGAFAWAEVGAALRLGDGESSALVDASRELPSRLPLTWSAMLAGDLSWRKARTLLDHTAGLPDEQAAVTEAATLPKAAGRTPAQHQAAVRRAVDRLDPAAADARRKQAKRDIALIRSHHGDGMGELFARLTSEDVEVVWLGADAWARRQKASGNTQPLDRLRVAALVDWAESFLVTGQPVAEHIHAGAPAPVDPDTGETASRRVNPATGEWVDDAPAAEPTPCPPRRHGRPVTVNLTWDLSSFLGLTDHPGEILGPGVAIPPQAMRDLVPGAELRRLLFHPLTGHLLDATPFAVRPAAPLAAFCALRDVTATTPTAGPTGTATAAGAGDLDHITPRARGGTTTRDGLHSPTRRWHRARTLGGWAVVHNPDQQTWTWTSPAGRTYTTRPHDYRLGP